MPTGYTNALLDYPNMSFADFAAVCAKAFLYDIRDVRTKPNEQTIEYNQKLKHAKKELAKFNAFDEDQRKNFDKMLFNSDIEWCELELKKRQKNLQTYQSMHKTVSEWNPSDMTSINLRKFMLDQIELCFPEEDVKSAEHALVIAKAQDPFVCWDRHINGIEYDIIYYTKRLDEQLQNATSKICKQIQASVNEYQTYLDQKK